ncbi:hypothetical protein MBLNU13_g02347t2 [Cladosporium sp. NU13]
MSSDGDDDPQSPSAFLEAPSSQSVVVDVEPFTSQSKLRKTNKFDQDSSEEERENRFNGPASTWRDYTADERALVASLDQERANDLSIHLYNAHALKSRLYDHSAADASKSWHSKHHWIKADEDGSTPWYPDVQWTAWPLHTDDVPRKSEGFGKDALSDDTTDGTLKMPVSWRAGADLDDEILALILRKAKERFRLRSKVENDPTARQPSIARSPSQMRSSPPVESRQSSVAGEASSHESENELETTETEDLTTPEFMMDDDEVKKLLGQSSRHVLTKFDILLMGLNRSRQYHTSGSTVNNKPASSRPAKRKRRSTDNEAPSASALGDDAEDQERPSGRDYTKHPSGKNPLYPRDWSEVLGVASLTGWNPAIIDRASKRCSALFGERILLRTMPETAAGKAEDKLTKYTPEMIPDFDIIDDMEEEEILTGESEVGFRCPEDSCPQHLRLYEKRFMIRQHLRRVHKYGQEALDAYDQTCALQDAEPSVEHLPTEKKNNESVNDDEQSELIAAVREDGYMKPVEVHLGRGTDVQDRKRRGEARS